MIERSQASKLIYLPTTSFIQNVASRAPVPGGGSVAALSGSLGAGLYVMVCRLSIPRVELEAGLFRDLVKKGMDLRDRLRDLIDADSVAYEEVIEAARLPADTAEEKETKAAQVAETTRKAAEVPYATAMACLEGLEWGRTLAEKCFSGAITDVGVGAQCLLNGFLGARLNVLVNLSELDEAKFSKKLRSTLDEKKPWAQEKTDQILTTVEKRLG